MARMLQALKNLEARSVKPAGEEWPAPLPAVTPITEEPMALATELPAAPARAARRAAAPATVREIEAPRVDEKAFKPPSEAPPLTPQVLPTPRAARVPIAPVAGRKPGSLERRVSRTLSDRTRAQPLVQLADRLRREAEQTASKTLLFVGVGEGSATHDTLLYSAAILAEKHGERVLLIDADLARHSLTNGLEQGQSTGLAELLKGSEPVRERCQPLALPGLSLLPAGLLRHVDLSSVGQRLEEVLRQAAEDFSLVMLDGGRSGDLSAAALARLSDATYFVVQLGTVETSEAQAALRDFRAASARVLGCIAT
jgi:Mrp family chromosome partitioning ATPase